MNALESIFEPIRARWIAGVVLAILLVATRSQHFAPLHALPAAGVAVLFVGGIVLRSWRAFAALFALAFATDVFAIEVMNVSSYCFTPAYVFMLPAYASLWFAGRWYARRHADAFRSLIGFIVTALASSTLCELLSSGGFYLFSGRFADLSVTEFADNLARYFPAGLEATAFWLAVAAGTYAVFAAAHARATARG